jgi:hypothetical protein
LNVLHERANETTLLPETDANDSNEGANGKMRSGRTYDEKSGKTTATKQLISDAAAPEATSQQNVTADDRASGSQPSVLTS